MTRPGTATSTPISTDEFADAMRAFAPFEHAPHLAIGVSGGADSMALAILADRWSRARGGQVIALIVDHGLRDESVDEAALTAARLMAEGVRAEILRWRDDKPMTGIQNAARQARYALLDGWCRRHGVLHLAVAHHADDQAETFMMRLQRGSGPDGLAAMAPVRELGACRLMRPLLDFPKARLVATLEAAGMGWVEDPSNRNSKYGRTVVRDRLEAEPQKAKGFYIATARFARARRALETATADWLARHAALNPAGYLRFSSDEWRDADEEIRLRVLASAARAIGGKAYPPDVSGLERLKAALQDGRGATLGRARFDPESKVIGVYREARNLPEPVALLPGTHIWDRRFLITSKGGVNGISVRPWGAENAGQPSKNRWPAWCRALPARARAGLPVIVRDGRPDLPLPEGCGSEPEKIGVSIRFQPTMTLSGSGFSVA